MPASKRTLIIGDVVVLGIVTAIGFITHRETDLSFAQRFAAIYIPLTIFWFVIAWWLRLFRSENFTLQQLWRVPLAMLIVAPLAVLVRAWILQTPVIPIFILALGGTSALGLIAWRAGYLLLRRRP